MRKWIVALISVLLPLGLLSQVSVNITGLPADSSAMLDVSSTDKGFLAPRLSFTERQAMSGPATGLIIYQTDNTPGIRINMGTPSGPIWYKLLDLNDLAWLRNAGDEITYLSNRTDSVGIGTDDIPTAKLQVRGVHTSTAGIEGIFTDVQNISTTTNTLSGLRFCGGSDPVYKAGIYFQKKTGNKGKLMIANDISGDANQVSVSDVKLMIDENGDVTINSTTTNGNELYLSGEAYKTSGTGSWLIPSDERLKDVKGSYHRGLKEIMELDPVYFQYRDDNDLGLVTGKEYVGLVAQKAGQVIPETVGYDDNGFMTFCTDPLLYTMLNAIKEQQKMIEELKEENHFLREKISELGKMIAQ